MSLIIFNFHGVGPIFRNIVDDEERDCWLEQDHFGALLDLARGQAHARLTFDDGNASDVEIVLPALLRRGLTATFFICSDRLDQPTFVSRAQVRELRVHGMSIGSHGAAHVSWRQLSTVRLRDEIEGSRQVLEKVCGTPVDSAACPFGDYDHTVLNALRRARYRSVYTSDGGVCSENHWLRARTSVKRSMTLAEVQLLIHQGLGTRRQLFVDFRKVFKRLR